VWSGGSEVRQSSPERGSGTILGVGMLAAVALLGGGAVAISTAVVHATHAQTVANQAALAASDVSRGLVPGYPCRVASALTTDAGFQLLQCDVVTGQARVVVGGTWWGLGVSKRAMAGPPPHPVFPGTP
jgi:secretion/DNA translocation related TadE-like protein